jgi:hypothetical protein
MCVTHAGRDARNKYPRLIVDFSLLYSFLFLGPGQGGSSNARPIVVLLELWLFVVGLSAALLS